MSRIVPVGIDLGTTNSAMAMVNQRGETEMIRTAEGELLVPSVVVFHGDRRTVGGQAQQEAADAPDRVAEHAKRDMGSPHYRRPIHGRQFPPEVIQGCILRKLQSDITRIAGESFQVVITVPAYFDEGRRKATADAGTMSGLDVLDIVNEPTAAALAFGEQLGYLDYSGAPRESLHVLVYDLGGGTFDVTVIELQPDTCRTLATDGDAQLGGVNWDLRLVEYAQEQLSASVPEILDLDAGGEQRLRRAAEDAKHVLSRQPEATIRFELGQREHSVPVTRTQFEELTQDLVERTAFTTNQALKAAGKLWSDIDRLILVGGSTRMPMIVEELRRMSSIEPDTNVHPDEAVARGAAIYAQFLLARRGGDVRPTRLKITDVNAHTLGIEGINQKTRHKENVHLIPRNTPLPVEIRRSFVTKEDHQQNVRVQMLEGDSSTPDQCTPLAKAVIRNLPPGLPKGTKIDVCYRYEANGCVTVTAEIPGVGRGAQIEMERVSGVDESHLSSWKTLVCEDGGYVDFEDALCDLMNEEVLTPSRTDAGTSAPRQPETSLEPAVHRGAPQAAATELRRRLGPLDQAEQRPRPATGGTGNASALRAIAYVVAGAIGLGVGYYVLCLIRPAANFLGIPLPGVSEPAEKASGPAATR